MTQGGPYAFEAPAHGFRGTAEPDAEVLGMVKELAWDHAGFKLIS